MFSWGRTLYSVNADGSDLHGIHGGEYFSLSPNGARIAHFIDYGTKFNAHGSKAVLYTTAPDGSDAHLLARRGDDGGLEAVEPARRPSAEVASCSRGIVVPDPKSNPALVQDCQTLVELIDRIPVAELNWDADTPITEWEGVTLEAPNPGEDGSHSDEPLSTLRVRGGSLEDRGLLGPFPLKVTELTGLWSLDVSGNDLYGTIPSELSKLTKLAGARPFRKQP